MRYADPPAHTLGRPGSCLAHGEAHTADHRRWTRRAFLMRTALAATGLSFVHQGMPFHAYGNTGLLRQLAQADHDRVLVLIQLNGGNDGLSTIIPTQNDLYYQLRPTLGVPAANTFALDADYAMYADLPGLESLWGDGQMAVVHSAGYPFSDLSHFRSMDIWNSGSDGNEILPTGWLGRYFDATVPNAGDAGLAYPLALQVGGTPSLLFQSDQGDLAMNIHTIDDLNRITESGVLFDPGDVPATPYGAQLSYLRTVANNTIRYPEAISKAYLATTNGAFYGAGIFGEQMATIGRLIKGGLGTRIYQVTLEGFDTHRFQDITHDKLIRALSEAVRALFDDLAAVGMAENVLVMTFSEFGRRVAENASRGTDHGAAAPIMLFGGGIHGGFFGPPPNLADLDANGNLKPQTDFRAVYATALHDWLGLRSADTDAVLGQPFPALPMIVSPVSTVPDPVPQALHLDANYPNPFRTATTVAFTLDQSAAVRLEVYDATGRRIRALAEGMRPAGRHTFTFEAANLPSGTYLCRLTTPHGQASRMMTLVR